MKILIAEDDNISRRLLEAYLKKKYFEVVVTKDGKEAWNELKKENPPPLAILDWMMPGMDGLDVCKKLRAKKTDRYIYVIMLTSKGRKEEIAAGLEAGADDYIVKPFNPVELYARVGVGLRVIQLQLDLKESIKKLKAFDEQKSEFLSLVSHEIRTPLAVIGEGVALCLDGIAGELTETQRDILTDIQDNVRRSTRLIGDLLDLSKIESGKIVLRPGSMDLVHLVKKLESGIGKQAIQKDLAFSIKCPEHAIKLFADSDKINQIFNNLISNAIRYTESGGTISVLIKDGKEYVECSVSDTGTGISKENQEKLFTKFTQFGHVTGQGYKGTGLGLVIVKAMIEQHGGDIHVDSEVGKGTTFTFTIKKIPFPKIMIVDDEPSVIETVKELLAEENYKLIGITDGSEVIQKAKDERPSLILLDIQLNNITGYEVLENLRKNEITKDIPVLVMSAYEVDRERIEKLKTKTPVPFLKKPFIPDQLKHAILAAWTRTYKPNSKRTK